jgi:hypothetical protein
MAMKKHYFPDTYMDNDYVKYYTDTYTFLNKYADLVIDYEDLIAYPEKMTENVCKVLGLNKMTMDYPPMKDSKEYEYLVSSKTVKEYQEDYFAKQDIEKCYTSYKELLTKSIKLT